MLTPYATKPVTSVVRVDAYWYPVCRSGELGKRPIARQLLGQPLVVFRRKGRGGEPAALLDRCAHRNIPLSDGKVVEDTIQCGYHGWRFDGAGGCRLIPGLSGDATHARGRRVPSFACREQDGLIWVYGRPDEEPDIAPYALGAVPPGYTRVEREVRATASLHATLENALDVPHTAFLHGGLFRDEGRRREIEARLTRGVDRAEVEYIGEPRPTGVVAKLLAPSGGLVEHWDRFILPSVAQVEYRLGDDSHVLVTAIASPISDYDTALFATIDLRLPVPGWLVRPVLEPIALRIFAQDAKVLSQQTAQIRRFGGEQYESTEIDLLGPQILKLLKRAERGRPLPTDPEPYARTVKMLV